MGTSSAQLTSPKTCSGPLINFDGVAGEDGKGPRMYELAGMTGHDDPDRGAVLLEQTQDLD